MKYAALLVLATVGIIAAQSAPEQRVTKEQKSLTAEKPATANDKQGDSKVTVIVKQENAASDNSKKEQDDENIKIQRRIAIFTALLVIVGLIQAVVLWLTIKAVNRQTATNQHIERAWVMADLKFSTASHFFHGDHMENGVSTQTISLMGVELHCVNDGNSPAWITEKALRLIILGRAGELPAKPSLSSKDVVQHEPEPLGPGGSSKKVLDIQGEGRHSLTTSTLVYGVIRYRDIFEKDRETWFCYQMSGYRTNYLLTRISGNPEYNRNT
jgi:hypothetical protein